MKIFKLTTHTKTKTSYLAIPSKAAIQQLIEDQSLSPDLTPEDITEISLKLPIDNLNLKLVKNGKTVHALEVFYANNSTMNDLLDMQDAINTLEDSSENHTTIHVQNVDLEYIPVSLVVEYGDLP